VFGERPLSNLSQELLRRERDRQEDEALKSRAMERARAALESERPSGIGLKRASASVLQRRPRRLIRALPLIAAALAAAGLAAAGVSSYVGKMEDEPRLPRPMKLATPPAPQVAAREALLGPVPSSDAPLERAPEPRAVAPSPDAETTRAPNVRQYATELALLEPARSSIGHGDYRSALTAIDQHRREFPNGQLGEEREALRVRALWGLGQRQTALAAAKSFRKHYPRSSLLSWLKAESAQTP
jgi:hypothetical protein